jgi:hypothetical protein
LRAVTHKALVASPKRATGVREQLFWLTHRRRY